GRFVGAELRVGRAAVVDDPRHRGKRLDVVQQRRPAPRALDRGERRTGARLRALPLEGLEQRGLLATDVCSVAAIQADVDRVLLAKRLRADIAPGPRLFDRLAQHPAWL